MSGLNPRKAWWLLTSLRIVTFNVPLSKMSEFHGEYCYCRGLVESKWDKRPCQDPSVWDKEPLAKLHARFSVNRSCQSRLKEGVVVLEVTKHKRKSTSFGFRPQNCQKSGLTEVSISSRDMWMNVPALWHALKLTLRRVAIALSSLPHMQVLFFTSYFLLACSRLCDSGLLSLCTKTREWQLITDLVKLYILEFAKIVKCPTLSWKMTLWVSGLVAPHFLYDILFPVSFEKSTIINCQTNSNFESTFDTPNKAGKWGECRPVQLTCSLL